MIKLLYKIRRPFKYKQFNAVYILMGMNIGFYIFTLFFDIIFSQVQTVSAYSFFGLSYTGVIRDHRIWQFFTYMFTHSMESTSSLPMHLFFNMFGLFIFGRQLEKKMGSTELLVLYLVCGFASGLLHFFLGMFSSFIPSLESYGASPLAGASGAVFALFLVYAVYFAETQLYFWGLFPLKAKYAVLIFGGMEFISLLSSLRLEVISGSSSNISNITHISGLIAAWLYLLIRKNINPAKVLFKSSRYNN